MIAPRLFRLERRRRERQRPRSVLALTLVGLACVGLALLGRPAPELVWNASASAPIGLYRVLSARPIQSGDMVLARPPDRVRTLAAERGYLPANVPLVKRIVGVGGDLVCAIGDDIFVGGRPVATRLDHDRIGRPLPAWTGCRCLEADEVFLLMEGVSDSFDGRYFGPVLLSSIIGRLVPLWTE